MLQFNFNKTKETISYFFIIFSFMLFLVDILFTNKVQILTSKQEKYQFYIETHTKLSNGKEYLNSTPRVIWNSNLENLIYVLSARLNLHKLVLKSEGIFLYGETKKTKAFNLFWEKLKVKHFFKSMKLIHWEQLGLNTWTYVIQIGF